MADNNNQNQLLVPQAQDELDRLKVEVAREIGWNASSPSDLQQQIDQHKYEVAAQIGVPLQHGYNGDLTSRQAGSIGGHIGGHLGGQMVKRMIALAEQSLAGRR